tara:strand:- start:970 stop:1602 length:633 start_codon:yes stop_codon:yes gene_type:complete
MSFRIYPSSANSLQGVAAKAELATESEFSINSANTLGYQTLLFTKDINVTLSPNVEGPVLIGKLPKNSMVFNSVCYSEGLLGTDSNGDIAVSGSNTTKSLKMRVEGISTNKLKTEILNGDLQYPDMVTGEFNPTNPTNPFISILREDDESPHNLQLVFKWLVDDNTTLDLSGKITVKVALQQMNPNNLESDGYPTGGIPSGPVPNSTINI